MRPVRHHPTAALPLLPPLLLLLAGGMLASRAAPAHAGTAAGAPTAVSRPAVVELYTSQGCSSCPPADALLGELGQRAGVLVLAFHVGYWDELGWPDRFALPFADQRQNRYAQRLRQASVFTPQVVVDGERSFIGSDRAAIILAASGPRSGVAIHLRADALALRIEVAAEQPDGDPRGELLLLALLREARTAIGRGENGGRTLREFNIVRAAFPLGAWDGTAHRYSLPRAALPPDTALVAALLQQPHQGAILGAASVPWH